MKLFLKTTRYESEVIPHARVAFITVLTGNDVLARRLFIVRTPFKTFRKFINPWSFQPDHGWCTFTFGLIYNVQKKKIKFVTSWDPME